MLRGCAGLPAAAINATAAKHRDRRLAHRDDMGARAQMFEKSDDVVDKIVEIEIAGRERHVARIVPIGQVNIVLGQHGRHRPAQERGEMPRHRRDQQHLRLLLRGILGEMQQGRERPNPDLFFAHGDSAVADLCCVDAELGPVML